MEVRISENDTAIALAASQSWGLCVRAAAARQAGRQCMIIGVHMDASPRFKAVRRRPNSTGSRQEDATRTGRELTVSRNG